MTILIKSKSLERGGRMKPQEKGYTLVELVIIILLFSLAVSSITWSERRIQEIAFETKINEVVSGIEYLKHRAAVTGTSCSIRWFENRILFMDERSRTIFKIYMEDGQSIDKTKSSSTNPLYFNGTMAPEKGITLAIKEVNLKKRGCITVELATGKIRIYYQKL